MFLPCERHIFWLRLHHGPCTIILISEVMCIIERDGEIETTVFTVRCYASVICSRCVSERGQDHMNSFF